MIIAAIVIAAVVFLVILPALNVSGNESDREEEAARQAADAEKLNRLTQP